jgi:hypothetical protein
MQILNNMKKSYKAALKNKKNQAIVQSYLEKYLFSFYFIYITPILQKCVI